MLQLNISYTRALQKSLKNDTKIYILLKNYKYLNLKNITMDSTVRIYPITKQQTIQK